MKCTRRAGLFFVATCFCFGQQVRASPEFDVASARPTDPGDLRGSTFEFLPGGGLKITNGTLRAIIESAYGVRDFQIIGGPGWLNSDRFSISATSASRADIGETRLKLRSLLAARFQLQVRRETREMTVYALVVARRTGPKLVRAPAINTGPLVTGIRSECGRMTGTQTSTANLAVYLERQLGRPVLDRTGLADKYNFQLAWTPDASPCVAADSPDAPSLFTAVREQLGLKLEATRAPVEVIVVDHAEKPD